MRNNLLLLPRSSLDRCFVRRRLRRPPAAAAAAGRPKREPPSSFSLRSVRIGAAFSSSSLPSFCRWDPSLSLSPLLPSASLSLSHLSSAVSPREESLLPSPPPPPQGVCLVGEWVGAQCSAHLSSRRRRRRWWTPLIEGGKGGGGISPWLFPPPLFLFSPSSFRRVPSPSRHQTTTPHKKVFLSAPFSSLRFI